MEVLICPTCAGKGEIREHIAHDYEIVTCASCNGTGRVLTCTYSYFVPFDTDKKKIYKVDTEVVRLLRELETKK